jgi:hypothetical protein
MARFQIHAVDVGDIVTYRNSCPPLSSWLVEEIDTQSGKAKCRGHTLGRELTIETPVKKLVCCVDAFLRGRRGVIESYRADFYARNALEYEAFAVWVDRSRARCRLTATIFEDGFRSEKSGIQVAKTIDKIVTERQWKKLAQGIESCGFWNLPSRDDNVGMDGSWWTLEGVKEHRYHYVRRWCSGPAVCAQMARLAGIWS